MASASVSGNTNSYSGASSDSVERARALVKLLAQNELEAHIPNKLIREEVFAAKTMKTLTTRYGTRGKSAKTVFLQGFKDELKGSDQKKLARGLRGDFGKGDKGQKDSAMESQVVSRPAAMVQYSKFCVRLEMLVRTQLFHLSLLPPPVETAWLYDVAPQETARRSAGDDPTTMDGPFVIRQLEELLDEPEEKMILRLKVYKRAMGALILHCEPLRPILREIKRSYDSVLKLRYRQLLESSWTAQNILTASKEQQEKTQKLTFEGSDIIKLMDTQCKQLMKHIDKQDAAIRIMADILNTLESALGEEFDFRRDSDDQNKLFIKDINEIRKKLGMPPRPEESGDAVAVDDVQQHASTTNEFHYTPDDPLILRKALEICRRDLFFANGRMEELEDEHKDEVPRHIQEQMKKDLETLKEDHVALKGKKEDMSSQVQGIRNQIDTLTSERNDLEKQAGELRIKITPRPSWEKIGEFVEGGVPKWHTIYDGKTSMDISNKVIEELNAKKTASPPEYLTALGDDPEIPRCLRHDTRVRDRRLARRDAEVIINDIWKTREQLLQDLSEMKDAASKAAVIDDFNDFDDGSVPLLTDFPDFVAQYFEEKFSNVNRRMEWSYNLVDACKRLTMNAKLTQFLGILMGKIDEGCYHLIQNELNRLRAFLQKRSMDLGTGAGKMTLGDFRRLLEDLYPYKGASEIKSILRTTAKQVKAHADWTMMNYDKLFVQSDEGFESEFVDEFTKQLILDRQKYVHEIVTGLLLDLGVSYDFENHEEDPAGDVDVQMKSLYKALVAVDPEITDATLSNTISWIYLKTSILPGMGPRGSLLLNYIRTRLTRDGGSDAADQVEFERAVNEIRDGLATVEEGESSARGRKRSGPGTQTKVIKLRVLIRRLKDTAIVRDGAKIKTPPKITPGSRYSNEYPGEVDDEYYYEEEADEETEQEEL